MPMVQVPILTANEFFAIEDKANGVLIACQLLHWGSDLPPMFFFTPMKALKVLGRGNATWVSLRFEGDADHIFFRKLPYWGREGRRKFSRSIAINDCYLVYVIHIEVFETSRNVDFRLGDV
jgi:hypothetical protein